ncbi:hypothetical protein [Candidatus Chloroploca asiatica]|uniref:DUF4352 domain-containing protein n=1 Tax=Candidatus Chloroploca asiatica TaxID=1506545 RepID=A0A2H3KMQ5_9CHLR|nr:hypothetical protein [Candidatus Chloroploca asiatica]PDV98638.1 hypothetical protein A9Q02_14750 [Candidatus Chloroploca asiatica]
MTTPPDQPSPSSELDQLLQIAQQAISKGRLQAGQRVLQALTQEYPDEPRVWLLLAELSGPQPAPTPSQAEAVLPQADHAEVPPSPHHEPVAAPVVPPPEQHVPEVQPDDHRTVFPLLNVLAMLVIVLLLGAIGVIIGHNVMQTNPFALQSSAPATANPINPSAELPIPTATAPDPTSLPPAPQATATASTIPLPTLTLSEPTATAMPMASPEPSPTTMTELPLGSILDHDGWSATLLRPDYAVVLDGSLGDLAPNGRFVLAVVAVSNNSPETRILPPTFFALRDDQERTYSPVPQASTIYLTLYQRGQHGDLALEEPLEPASGMRSIPILFDVPLEASGLRLTTPSSGGAGWPIGESQALPAGP